MSKEIDKMVYKDHNIKIYYDERECNNPVLSNLNKGIIAYLPNIKKLFDFNIGIPLTEDEMTAIENSDEYVSIPIYIIELENRYVLTTKRTDTKRFGLIYNDKENIFSKNPEVDFEKEVKLFSDFIEGKVYGYEIYNSKDSLIDSCWGYIGVSKEDVLEEAQKLINNIYSERYLDE
jgi:hypothetical protein